jgi:2-polyprenyl-6-methoxyphenol hydroxylase-like FAD-dependent oxidoreductase
VPPTGGEGANTAIFDSASLAKHLANTSSGQYSVEKAINKYEKEMLNFSWGQVSSSDRMSRLITMEGYVLPYLFGAFLRVVNLFFGASNE